MDALLTPYLRAMTDIVSPRQSLSVRKAVRATIEAVAASLSVRIDRQRRVNDRKRNVPLTIGRAIPVPRDREHEVPEFVLSVLIGHVLIS